MRIGYKYHTILGQLAILHFKRNMFDWSVESAALLYQLRFSCFIISSHKQLGYETFWFLVLLSIFSRCLYFYADSLATN